MARDRNIQGRLNRIEKIMDFKDASNTIHIDNLCELAAVAAAGQISSGLQDKQIAMSPALQEVFGKGDQGLDTGSLT